MNFSKLFRTPREPAFNNAPRSVPTLTIIAAGIMALANPLTALGVGFNAAMDESYFVVKGCDLSDAISFSNGEMKSRADTSIIGQDVAGGHVGGPVGGRVGGSVGGRVGGPIGGHVGGPVGGHVGGPVGGHVGGPVGATWAVRSGVMWAVRSGVMWAVRSGVMWAVRSGAILALRLSVMLDGDSCMNALPADEVRAPARRETR